MGIRLVKVKHSIFISHVSKHTLGWCLGLSVGDRVQQVGDVNLAGATILSACEVLELIKAPSVLVLIVRDTVLMPCMLAAEVEGMRKENDDVMSVGSECSGVNQRSLISRLMSWHV